MVSATSNPLVARYSVKVPLASEVYVEFGPDQNYGRRASALTSGAETVSSLVAGMRASPTETYGRSISAASRRPPSLYPGIQW